MKVFGHSVGLRPWATVAAFGVALANSLNSFRVGATRTMGAEMLIAPVAIVVGVVGLGIGFGAANRKSARRVAVLLWIALALFLVVSLPRWGVTDAEATRRILIPAIVVGVYAAAATWAGLLFNDGAILRAMRGIVLLNAAVTVVQLGLSLILHRGVIMPWQTPILLNPYRPCGWFEEPSHYGIYVALWASMDHKRPTLAVMALVILALLAGGSIMSLVALILIVVPWTKLAWRRKGPIVGVLAVLAMLVIIIVALRFPAVRLRLGQLNNGSAFARVTKTPLVLSYLWQVSGVGILFGYGPAALESVINGYRGSFSVQVLSSGSYLNGWGVGIGWWGIVGVLLCWLIWIVASRRRSSFRQVASIALVLAVLQLGAEISPSNIVFWLPALVMSSGTSLYGVRYAKRSGCLTPDNRPILRR